MPIPNALAPRTTPLERIVRRLVGDDSVAFLGFIPRLEIKDSTSPFAYGIDGDRIVVASALLNLLEREDDMAFVLAHELGHLVMHHDGGSGRTAIDGSHRHLESLIQKEIDADTFAANLLASARYSRDAGPNVIRNLARGGAGGRIRLELFPSLARRLRAMETQ